jgi:basic membrane protein A
MMKRLVILFLVFLISTTFLPACTPATADCTSKDLFCVGLVTDIGKVNDKSFNQSCWEGLQQANKELSARVEYIETADAKDYAVNIGTFADEGFDVIVTCGFKLGDATAAAAKAYPKTDFIGVDQFQTDKIAGLAGLNFPEDQAGFLVGALAAMMSRNNQIGAVCGPDTIPAVWRFGEGYKAGAAYIDGIKETTTEVFVVYHEDNDQAFIDTKWGADTAKSMVDEGADVIFGCGGLTGNSAIITAAQSDAYAIGVDTDQYFTLPEAAPLMLSSAMKLITPGVLDLIKLSKEGAFPSGNYLGKVGYAPFHDAESKVPADVKAEMETINSGLLDGSIKTGVPSAKP